MHGLGVEIPEAKEYFFLRHQELVAIVRDSAEVPGSGSWE